MPEYADYFDPFFVEVELPPGCEYDPFAGGQDLACGLLTALSSDTVRGSAGVHADDPETPSLSYLVHGQPFWWHPYLHLLQMHTW